MLVPRGPEEASSSPTVYVLSTSLRDMVLLSLQHSVTPVMEQETPHDRSGLLAPALSSLMRLWDPYTAGHQLNVGDLAYAIALRLSLPVSQAEASRTAGYFHDVGKLIIPLEVLTHPGRLSPAEFELMAAHPELGYEILTTSGFPPIIATVARQHHERLDGSGYPYGLSGADILLETRIVSVADTIEAIANARLYRPALGVTFALEVLSSTRGNLFDTAAVDAARALFDEGYQLSPGAPGAPRA